MSFRLSAFLDDFDWAARSFYEKQGRPFENFVRGSSLHFHQRVMGIHDRRGRTPRIWIDDEHCFYDLLYAVLATWGMDQFQARLVDFFDFENGVRALVQSKGFCWFENRSIGDGNESWTEPLQELWDQLSEESKIMVGSSILVGSSKLLHHLLPHALPPIDRKYTLGFMCDLDSTEPFSITGGDAANPNFEVFRKAVLMFADIARRVPNIGSYLGTEPCSASTPKIIDNAIIAWWGTPDNDE